MGYSARDIANMLSMSVDRVRTFARAGFLDAERGPRGELRFSFQDLVLLQAAQKLLDARIPPRKVKRALANLKRQLPSGRPLATVRIAAHGDDVVVRDGDTAWEPESGQVIFDFAVGELASKVAPFALRAVQAARADSEGMTAEDWYELGCDLLDRDEARDAFRRALELDPQHADAAINLGMVLHEQGQLRAAEAQYRAALLARPDDATALYNLGVALEDLGRADEAIASYERALSRDGACADAHFNVARLYERAGRKPAALRHLKAYKKLVQGP